MDKQSDKKQQRYAVVGGGVSGLTAAYRLRRLKPDAEVRVIEASSRLGGPLETIRSGGCLVERGADSFTTKLPAALELCRELGLENELISTNDAHRRALVVRGGALLPVPEGFVLMKATKLGAVLRTPVLSPLGKLRLMFEPLVPSRSGVDESLASFARRRLGSEAFERLVQPLAAGIYTSDGEQLSMAATMPEFLEAEREHGSLYGAVRAAARQNAVPEPAAENSGARYSLFVSLRDGVFRLIERLAEEIGMERVALGSAVAGLRRREDGQWEVSCPEGGQTESYDGVVLATPAATTGKLVASVDAELAGLLGEIEAASSTVVSLVYPREAVRHALDGFGFVTPASEGRGIIAGSFASVKFAGRAADGRVVIRAFLGGAVRPELAELDDEASIALARDELRELIGAEGEPVSTDVRRWTSQMPQYHVGHLELVDRIERRVAELPGLALAGCSYRGVGIPQCVASGDRAARSLVTAGA